MVDTKKHPDDVDELMWDSESVWDTNEPCVPASFPVALAPMPNEAKIAPDEIFSDNVMDRHPEPLAYYLEREGWEVIQRMRRPTSKTWLTHCPKTYAIAEAIYEGLPQKQVWGKQGLNGWMTLTQGKQIKIRKGRFLQKSMGLIDVLNSLGNLRHYSLGSHDRKLEELAGDDWYEFDRVPITRVSHLRLDVDMDDAYREDMSYWGIENGWDKPKPEWVRRELAIEQSALCAMALYAYFFRTGRRGHQIVIPTPVLDRSVASLVILMMRTLLSSLEREPNRAQIDKSNLDGLLRLPLGRHSATDNVTWFLDPDTGNNVPLEEQAQALEEAWVYQRRGCEVLEESANAISDALLDMGYDRDIDVTAGVRDDMYPVLLTRLLNDLRERLPDCPLLDAFQAATGKLLPYYAVSDFVPLSEKLFGQDRLSDDVENQDKITSAA